MPFRVTCRSHFLSFHRHVLVFFLRCITSADNSPAKLSANATNAELLYVHFLAAITALFFEENMGIG